MDDDARYVVLRNDGDYSAARSAAGAAWLACRLCGVSA